LLRATPAPRGGAASTYDFVSHGGHTSITPRPPSPPPLGHLPEGGDQGGRGGGGEGEHGAPVAHAGWYVWDFQVVRKGATPAGSRLEREGKTAPQRLPRGEGEGTNPLHSPRGYARGDQRTPTLYGAALPAGGVSALLNPSPPRGGGEGLQSERESPPSNVRGPPPLKFFQLPTPVTIAFSISNFKFF